MKNLLLTLAIIFSFSLNAQYAVMYAVDLNEGAEEDYLSLEKFWSEIHSEALNQGSMKDGQFGKELLKMVIKNQLQSILFLKVTLLWNKCKKVIML